ncbi:50S ribosomal protein L11 [Candidatus Berkelbacteria bacterium CG10_big_fil_rev_8_21_14_0_10_41_12]|uniref:Large ribosomal subunit protein uL11 n=1 Tax=Candidatus Berkelbacteria bacterium CG10_big_fil_rev_8_21_14_0_10_41_12 TaxID=1974513 RepID=A0A2M6WXT2_9BACT|nr:MAG: 50S ribosomal protein L11 [Candidatus Berkelbacteria bacterium CG10_big_fil_rev_8_21_14_0_10_41_12]
MAKKIKIIIKIQAPAGKANPAPPIGPALGQHGVNIIDFVNKFNEQTKEMGDVIVPAEITVFEDRSFSFVLKSPPAADLLMKAAKISKGSSVPNKDKVGTVSMSQVREIAEKKIKDLNAYDIEQAAKIIAGTARSMGIKVEGK